MVYVLSKIKCSLHIFQFVIHVYSNHNSYHANIFQIILRTLYEVPDQSENNEMVLFRSLHYVPEESLVLHKSCYYIVV